MVINDEVIPEFWEFLTYYGDTDYADKWVQAAANKRSTDFSSTRGNQNFSTFHERLGQAEAMKKGSAYMNIWMQVVRDIRAAVLYCPNNKDGAEAAIDRAATLYTGSLTTTSQDEGILLYALASIRAHQFRTAGEHGNASFGKAFVNVAVMRAFSQLKAAVVDGESACLDAGDMASNLINYMKVPLIQSTLRQAYVRGQQYLYQQYDLQNQERLQAELAVHAATILPFVHSCDSLVAAEVYEEVKIGADTNFTKVKGLLESMYGCLGVTCELIGGLWDRGIEEYFFPPCLIDFEASSESPLLGTNAIIGFAVGGSVILLLVVVAGATVFSRIKRKRKALEVETESNPEGDQEDPPGVPPGGQSTSAPVVVAQVLPAIASEVLPSFKDQVRPDPNDPRAPEKEDASRQVATTGPSFKDQCRR